MASIITWIAEHAWVPLLAASTAIASWLLLRLRLRFFGSRRNSRNWAKTQELYGDLSLLRLGVKRVNPDTASTEGDAASIYYQTYTSYVYEVTDGIRYCYRRSFVIEVYAFYQWEAESGRGDNLMTQFASEPIPCMGLEEKKDEKGASYWVKVSVPDVQVAEHTRKLSLVPSPQKTV